MRLQPNKVKVLQKSVFFIIQIRETTRTRHIFHTSRHVNLTESKCCFVREVVVVVSEVFNWYCDGDEFDKCVIY